MASSGMLLRVALIRTDVSGELSPSIIKVTRIGELGITLAVTINRRTLRRNTKPFFIVTAVKTSNLTCKVSLLNTSKFSPGFYILILKCVALTFPSMSDFCLNHNNSKNNNIQSFSSIRVQGTVLLLAISSLKSRRVVGGCL
jgi:hypothetical protein